MEEYKKFQRISDAFCGYYNLFKICRKCEKFSGNALCFHFIRDVVSISFIIEIGFKALLAYEGKKEEGTHKLIVLFELLSTEMQERIVNATGYLMDEFKKLLAENSNNFVEWRYYYEISESDKRLTSSNGFMDKLLSGIAIVICDIIEASPCRIDEMSC